VRSGERRGVVLAEIAGTVKKKIACWPTPTHGLLATSMRQARVALRPDVLKVAAFYGTQSIQGCIGQRMVMRRPPFPLPQLPATHDLCLLAATRLHAGLDVRSFGLILDLPILTPTLSFLASTHHHTQV